MFHRSAIDAVRHADVERPRIAAHDINEIFVFFHGLSNTVILSEVGSREASANAVEGPRATQNQLRRFREFSPRSDYQNAFPRPCPAHANWFTTCSVSGSPGPHSHRNLFPISGRTSLPSPVSSAAAVMRSDVP